MEMIADLINWLGREGRETGKITESTSHFHEQSLRDSSI